MFKRLIQVVPFAACLQLMGDPVTPQTILADGVDHLVSVNPYTSESGEARKGTVAATLNNIARLNELLLKENNRETEDEIRSIISSIDKLIPSLKVIGMFDLFEPSHWLGHGEQIGRIVALSLYLKHYPEKDTANLGQKIVNLGSVVKSQSVKDLFQSIPRTK